MSYSNMSVVASEKKSPVGSSAGVGIQHIDADKGDHAQRGDVVVSPAHTSSKGRDEVFYSTWVRRRI